MHGSFNNFEASYFWGTPLGISFRIRVWGIVFGKNFGEPFLGAALENSFGEPFWGIDLKYNYFGEIILYWKMNINFEK